MEVLIAVTLLSLLSAGMLYAMRLGLNAYSKTGDKLMYNRRVVGAQRILEEELQGLMPVVTTCGSEQGTRFGFFQGREQVMHLITTFSLAQASRGLPQILELFVIPGEDGNGVRLVVNETKYTGPRTAGASCVGPGEDGIFQFLPPQPKPESFVLADKLAYCRFRYFTPGKTAKEPQTWRTFWGQKGWPLAIRVEMAPAEPNPSRLQPISVTAPIFLYRSPDFQYADQQ
jgi:hypothetical protein